MVTDAAPEAGTKGGDDDGAAAGLQRKWRRSAA
jgi:hypothetical protein